MNRLVLACLVGTTLLGCDLMKRDHAVVSDAGAVSSAAPIPSAAPSASVAAADSQAPAAHTPPPPPPAGSAPGVVAEPNAPPSTESHESAAQTTITKANYKGALDKLEKEDLSDDKK